MKNENYIHMVGKAEHIIDLIQQALKDTKTLIDEYEAGDQNIVKDPRWEPLLDVLHGIETASIHTQTIDAINENIYPELWEGMRAEERHKKAMSNREKLKVV